MEKSSNPSRNPYESPSPATHVRRSNFDWWHTVTAMIFGAMPCVTTWAYLELIPLLLPEPTETETGNALKTPNPEKAPWYFVSHTQEFMMWTNPRLAIVALRWSYIVYAAVPLWGFAAPRFLRRDKGDVTPRRHTKPIGLIPASILVGLFLAWPWLFAIFFRNWLHP
jgi:hypothetical protein